MQRQGARLVPLTAAKDRAIPLVFAASIAHRVALAALVALAAVLRLAALESNPVALNQDEAVNGYDAFSLGLTLRDHHGYVLPVMLQSFGDWVSPLLTYLTVPFVRLLGLSVVTIRLPVALLGIAAVPLLYALVRRLCGRNDIALLAAAILAVSPWSIMLSRWAIPPSIVPFFVILFVLALVGAADASAIRPLVAALRGALAALAAAALTYAYPAEKLFVPLLLAAALALMIRRDRLTSAVLAGAYLALIAPIVLLTLANPARYNARFADVSLLHGSIPHALAGSVLRYLLSLSPIALFGSGDSDMQHHLPGFGSTFAFLAPFFYLGVLFTLWAARGGARLSAAPARALVRPRHASLLLTWLALFPLPVALTSDYMHVLRAVQGLPLVPIFAAIGIAGVIDALARARLRRAVYAVLLVVGVAATSDFTVDYFTNYREASKAAYQYGLRDVFAYVLPRRHAFRTIVVDAAINQPYIYLLFYAREDPRGLNHAELEPQPGTPTVHRFGTFRFEPVDARRIAGARVIRRVGEGSAIWYQIYQTPDHVCLVQRVKPAPSAPPPLDFPAEIKLMITGVRS